MTSVRWMSSSVTISRTAWPFRRRAAGSSSSSRTDPRHRCTLSPRSTWAPRLGPRLGPRLAAYPGSRAHRRTGPATAMGRTPRAAVISLRQERRPATVEADLCKPASPSCGPRSTGRRRRFPVDGPSVGRADLHRAPPAPRRRGSGRRARLVVVAQRELARRIRAFSFGNCSRALVRSRAIRWRRL